MKPLIKLFFILLYSIIFLVLGVALLLLLSLSTRAVSSEVWSIEAIELFLDTKLPDTRNVLVLAGNPTGYAPSLHLVLFANLSDLIYVGEHICKGELYEGYNPFNAIFENDSEHFANYAVIRNFGSPYVNGDLYSYSPTRVDNLLGTQCFDERGTFKVSIENHSNVGRLELMYMSGCYSFCSSQQYDRLIQHDAPILVRGFDTSVGRLLVHRSLCIDVDPRRFVDEAWSNQLVGATVDFTIDDSALPQAFISLLGNIIALGNEEREQIERENRYFSYCYRADFVPGPHRLEVKITTIESVVYEYFVNFTYY